MQLHCLAASSGCRPWYHSQSHPSFFFSFGGQKFEEEKLRDCEDRGRTQGKKRRRKKQLLLLVYPVRAPV